MLMNFKNCAEDEDCPVPDDVREALQAFHNALLGHCGQFCSSHCTPQTFHHFSERRRRTGVYVRFYVRRSY